MREKEKILLISRADLSDGAADNIRGIEKEANIIMMINWLRSHAQEKGREGERRIV